MKTIIEIECSDFDDLLLHLSVIRSKFKKLNKSQSFDDETFKSIEFDDANCYGDHKVTVNAL